MKETIEWHYTVEEVLPFNGADVLMKLGGPGEVQEVVAGFYYTKRGFILPLFGDPVSPSMWCYFPKGQQ